MSFEKTTSMPRRMVVFACAALAIAALVLGAYRELLARPFAADDYQWLLNVRGLSLGEIMRRAFDAGEQTHFYRPLVWLLFWAQVRAFDLAPAPFHLVSLALHLLNAGLAAGLVWRLIPQPNVEHKEPETVAPARFAFLALDSRFCASALAAGMVALHPAPFEAVVWISGQSELLAAALLLLALHFWLPLVGDKHTSRQADGVEIAISQSRSRAVSWPRLLLASLALGLALLAKESAVIGLALLALIDPRAALGAPATRPRAATRSLLAPYLLPALLTLGYLALQLVVERRNYLLRQGGYGFGPQIVLNPLRSLALIVAPLPGSEHADASWLVPVGTLLALALLALLVRGRAGARRLALALGLTLLPAAPFISPPDSRYLYLPVLAAAIMLALGLAQLQDWYLRTRSRPNAAQRTAIGALAPWAVALALLLGAGLSAANSFGELRARENRFAGGTGPGGSLWRLVSSVCAEQRPDRLIVVEPPVAEPHVLAIAELACGPRVRSIVVGRAQVEDAIKGHSVIISFPNGSAAVERTT